MIDQLITWRRKLHANPELSFQEFATAKFIKEELAQLPNMHVEVGVGYPTAVVGTLKNGPGPVIAIRADMDALPIHEENEHEFTSQNAGVMHACGHDAHMAIALGTATRLSEAFQHNELQGTVKVIFQPAEEMADEYDSTGAPYMINAGVLNDVDAVIALHMSPENPVGEMQIHDGYSMAAVDVFSGKIKGTGGHGAYPHLGTDPIRLLAQLLPALYELTSRMVSPLDPSVISVGQVIAGSASNVIPSEVEITGTIRSYDPHVQELLQEELGTVFRQFERPGITGDVSITTIDPALKNDPAINALIKTVITDFHPEMTIKDTPFGMGGEDFAHMTSIVPGSMFFLGCGKQDQKVRSLHTPTFDIDERCLPIGVSILTETAKRFLGG